MMIILRMHVKRVLAPGVFKLTSELKQGSCLLQVLRKIYLYLQFDVFKPVEVTV